MSNALQSQYLQFKNNLYNVGITCIICLGFTTYFSFVINDKLNFLLKDTIIKHDILLQKITKLQINNRRQEITEMEKIEEIQHTQEIKKMEKIEEDEERQEIKNENTEIDYLSDSYENIPNSSYTICKDNYTNIYNFWKF